MPRLKLITKPSRKPLRITGHFLRRLELVDRYRASGDHPNHQNSLDIMSERLRECIEYSCHNKAILRQADWLVCDIDNHT